MRPRVRMPCLLVYGVSGAGKSMLLEKFKRDNAPKRIKSDGHRPIIATQMPPVPVVRSLYGEIVRTLGSNVRPTARFYELEHEAITLLTHAHPKLLIIDEIQHLLSCSAREQRAALNMVKYISNELRMSGRVQIRYPGRYSHTQLHTLQKRVRAWRQQAVQRLINEISRPPNVRSIDA